MKIFILIVTCAIYAISLSTALAMGANNDGSRADKPVNKIIRGIYDSSQTYIACVGDTVIIMRNYGVATQLFDPEFHHLRRHLNNE